MDEDDKEILKGGLALKNATEKNFRRGFLWSRRLELNHYCSVKGANRKLTHSGLKFTSALPNFKKKKSSFYHHS